MAECLFIEHIELSKLYPFPDHPFGVRDDEAMEDDYGMIDGIINNGPRETEKAVSKTEETKSKKPSVLAKLRQYQDEDRKETTMHRSAERGL